jgi:hypothetical protein
MFMTDLNDLTKVIYKPAGYFMAPEGEELVVMFLMCYLATVGLRMRMGRFTFITPLPIRASMWLLPVFKDCWTM